MSDHLVRATSDEVGLRRESSVDTAGIPLWLARLHRSLPVGATVRLSVGGDLPISIEDLLEGAGFAGRVPETERLESLPDIVRPGLDTLVCGLNPGVEAARTGVPYGRRGNRFWPAAIAAGLVERDRDTDHAMLEKRVGFTDLAKRTSRRAEDITRAEFAAGAARLRRLLGWVEPSRLIVVGLTGWRQVVDRSAEAGWQERTLDGVPVYVMPNTSGLNTHETLESLTAHLRKAQAPS